jgi:hypothetical protein
MAPAKYVAGANAGTHGQTWKSANAKLAAPLGNGDGTSAREKK